MRRRNQKVAKWAALAGLALALGSRAEANTTYTYTGKPFTTFDNLPGVPNPYSTSDFIQVTFTTVNPLPPNQPFPYIPNGVVSLQMTDGVDPMGTVGCSSASFASCAGIAVATDANGAISQWIIISVTCPSGGCTSTSGLITEFGTENVAQAGVAAGVDFAVRCGTTVAGCGPTTTTGEVALALSLNAGTWSRTTTEGAQTTIKVTLSTSSPAVFGQPITLSVTVLDASTGAPAPGSVQLFAGSQACGGITPCNSINLDNNGAATITAPDPVNGIPDPSTFTFVGQNQIGALYIPFVESNYLSNVGTVPVTVLPTISVSPNPAVYGQPLTFLSTVGNPNAPAKITSVVFTWDDGPTSPQVPVNATTGQAQFTPQSPQFPIAVGSSHYVQAAAYSAQTTTPTTPIEFSNTLSFTVAKASTATGLTLSQSGSSATLTATVAVVAPGAGTPTGTVSFLSGSKVLANAPLTKGVAMLSLSSFSGAVTATYSGDTNFTGSTSSPVTVNTSPPPPPPPPPPPSSANLSLSSSLNPSQIGQAVTFTASLTVTSGTGTPSGSIQFLDGTTSIGSAALSGGSASITTSSLAVGSHAIIAQYSGDGTFPGTTASLGQVVNRLASTLTLNVSATQVNAGQSVTLTAQVGPAPPSSSSIPAPSGQVSFSAAGNSLGTAAISGGSASFTTVNLPTGTVQVSASYGGDKNYAASSATATVTVIGGPLKITTTSLPDGALNQPYMASVAAMGGSPPYKFGLQGLPAGLTSDATGAITGAPTAAGSFSVTAQVTDHAGATANGTLTLNVSSPSLVTVSATLPDGKQGANYSGSVSVSGGAPPYKLVISGLPSGVTAMVSASGASATVSGQPTTAGSFTVSVQATDSKGVGASKTFPVNIASSSPTITPVTPGTGMAGQPYSQCITATGGTPPFTFSATLPSGLSINPTTGCISGTPSVGGPATITVNVTDSTGAKTTVTFTVNFALPALSPVNFTGLGSAADPRTQPGFGVTLTGPYPTDIQGTLTLTFQPASGADTGEVTFATGSRTLTFTIPATSTNAVFTIPTAALQTGTVAGSITITASFNAGGTDITPSPAPTKQIQVNVGPPVIVSATASRNSNGFTVSITGYTSTREISQATFVFNPATGANLQTTSLTLQVGSLFSPWLQGTQVIGSQFLFTQPFTVTGNLQAVASITVTLMNGQGSSQPITATIQ